jgi:hypothetical protein
MSMWFAENLGVSNEKRCKKLIYNSDPLIKICKQLSFPVFIENLFELFICIENWSFGNIS